ncbi:MAG: phosphodiesterase [Streptosporangiales bacterium]|nr:phosphodiesterase [Streptosporangiales bacterium]
MTTSTLDDLRSEIERCGYFPELVVHGVEGALATESARDWIVHHEATFDAEMEVRRHVSVLVLTDTRLIVLHTDDHPPADPKAQPHATTSVEAVPLRSIQSVLLSSVIPEPARYRTAQVPTEATLTVGWGIVGRVDLEPAGCADENCDADHGYTGQVTSDDLTLRVSGTAEGDSAVQRLIDFAAALSVATSRPA